MTNKTIIHILQPADKRWSDFYDLPDDIYRDDPNYAKSSVETVKKSVGRPEFADAQLPLLALSEGQARARMVVRCSKGFYPYEEDQIGLISFFESYNNASVVKALFQAAINWLKEREVKQIIGPMDGDTWHKYRFNVGPHERNPFMLEPYNPAYYPKLFEDFGFQVLAKYFSKHVGDVKKVLPKMEKYYQRTLRNGFTYRRMRVNRFDEELEILYDLSVKIFAKNQFYTEISLAEFKKLYTDAKSIIDENLVWFCQDKDDQYCGFVFSFVDYFVALKKMNAKKDMLSKLKFWMNKRKADTVNIKSLGVTPDHRKSGLGAALMYKTYEEGYKLGFNKANMCLIHEDNASAQLDAGEGEIFRNYYLYAYRI